MGLVRGPDIGMRERNPGAATSLIAKVELRRYNTPIALRQFGSEAPQQGHRVCLIFEPPRATLAE